MGLFDQWAAVTGLEPGIDYRCRYTVYCVNAVSNASIVAALAAVGIITASPDVSGPLTAAISGSEMHFGVSSRMSLAEFLGKLQAAFQKASEGALFECSLPDVQAVEESKPVTLINPGTAFGGGAVFALVVIVGVAIFVWRAK